MKPPEAEVLAAGVIERRKPQIQRRRTKTVLSPKTLISCVHRGDFRFDGVAVKMARVFIFFCRVPKSGCVSAMFRGASMRVARAARGASLCQEKPGMQPDENHCLETAAFCQHCALTESVSVRGCMRASGSKVAVGKCGG